MDLAPQSRTPSGTIRAVVMASTVLWLLAGAMPAVSGQRGEQEPPASVAASVWDDAARLRALAERTEPWPLRDYPAPPGVLPAPAQGCRPGEGLPVVIGEARLRLPGFTFVVPAFGAPPDERNRLNAHLRAMPQAEFCRGPAPADWSAATRLRVAFLEFTFLATDALDRRCYRPGLPGDPRPECDRPHDSRWWKAFVAGLPLDLTLEEPGTRTPEGAPIGLGRSIWSLPGRTLEPRPAGGWTVRDAAGLARGVVLPRLGGEEDTREPLIPACILPGAAIGGGWRPPGPPEEEARLPRAWTRCQVSYRHRGVLAVTYRFYREVFDEPDIPALDLRVRRLVQKMLDGGTSTKPAQTP
jgi:hypothetical protein